MLLRHAGFLGGVVFAGVAAVAFRPIAGLAVEWMSSTTAAALTLVLIAAAYVALMAEARSHALGALTVVLGLGVTSAVLAERLVPTALVLSLAIAYGRARIFCRQRVARPWITEACLGLVALIAADAVATADRGGIALAVWAYWLVQSAYALLPARGDGGSTRAGADSFDDAMRRATDLMDGSP